MSNRSAPPRSRGLFFVGLYCAMAAVVVACASGSGAATASAAPTAMASPPHLAIPEALASAVDTGYPHPRDVYSVGGLLDVRLAVVRANLAVGTGTQSLRAYQLLSANGVNYSDGPRILGPTFHIKQGDLVRINLINQLVNPDTNCLNYQAYNNGIDHYPDCFHGSDYTNIHYHGFHVTPDSSGDNVLIQVAPGDSFQYSMQIPYNQSPGTHWYHPHKHGSVAMQVTNGMSGAFVIHANGPPDSLVARGGGLDLITEQYGMREFLLAVQQVDSSLKLVYSGLSLTTLVNGEVSPVIELEPGEVARLRIVNENTSATASLSVFFPDSAGIEPNLYDIARDGVQLSPLNYSGTVPNDSLWMSPGNRLDAWIQAPVDTGTDVMFAIRSDSTPTRKLDAPGARLPGRPNSVDTIPLVIFRVRAADDTPPNTTVPPSIPPLPSFLQNLPGSIDSTVLKADTSSMPTIVFTDSGNHSRATPTQFFLGTAQTPRMQYDPQQVYVPTSSAGTQMPMTLGQTQTWRVMNYSAQNINHPFHIHINPFQVLYVSHPNANDGFGLYYDSLNAAAARGAPVWLDVLPLPEAVVANGTVTQPGYAIIRQQYDDFTGYFVMHCHILGHEERGMMQVLEIVPPGVNPSPPPASGHSGGGGGAHRH